MTVRLSFTFNLFLLFYIGQPIYKNINSDFSTAFVSCIICMANDKEVHKSKCLSNVRIHVERVIGKMRNYLIPQSTIPVNQVRLLDDIV